MNKNQLEFPLFILGSPRSGTSLLRLMLTSHSHILIPPECGFIVWLSDLYDDWCVEDNDSIRLNLFVDDLLECRKFETWGLAQEEVVEYISLGRPETYAELCVAVVAVYAKKFGEVSQLYWGDKNNFYLNHIEKLYELFPNAKFLHIVRDGRDIVCSYREVMNIQSSSPFAPKFPVKIADISSRWSEDVLGVDESFRALPSAQCMTLKYEDLVANTPDTLAALCEWLGLSYECGMELFYIRNKELNLEPALTLDWKKRTLTKVSDETVGRYKKFLNKDELLEFNYAACDALRRYNYL